MNVEIEVQLAISRALAQSEELFNRLDRARVAAASISVNAANIRLPSGSGGASGSSGSASSNASAVNALSAAIARQRATAATAAAATQSLNNAISALVAASHSAATAIQTLAIQQARQATAAQNANAAQQQATVTTNGLIGGVARLAASYLTLNAAWSFTADSIRQAVAVENLQNTLTATSGSAQQAASDLAFLRAEAQRIGISFIDSADGFVKFSVAVQGAGMSGEFARDTFTALAEASRRLGLSGSQQASVFLALEQMISKGVVSMQELRLQLGNALPGAFQTAARAMGVTTQELSKLVETGNLASSDFLPKFVRQLAKDLPATAETLASTSAELERLGNAWQDFKAKVGGSIAVKGGASALTGIIEIGSAMVDDRTAAEIGASRSPERKRRAQIARDLTQGDTSFFSGASDEDINRWMAQEAKLAKQQQERIKRQAEEAKRIAGSDEVNNADIERATKFWRTYRELEAETLTEEENKRQDIINRYDELTQKIRQNKDGFSEPMLEALTGMAEAAKENQLAIFDEEEWKKTLDEADKDWQQFLSNLRSQERAEKKAERMQPTPLDRNFGGLRQERGELQQLLPMATTVEDFEAISRRIVDINRAMYEQLKANNAGWLEAMKFGFSEVVDAWGSAAERMAQVGMSIADSLQSNVTQGLFDMATATESPKQAVAEMAESIGRDFLRIAIQELVVKQAIAGLTSLAGFGGAGGSIVPMSIGAGGTVTAGHSGMVVGREGVSSQFIPRFHSGSGPIGDEQMVMARRGEVILTPEQMKLQGQSDKKPIMMINLFDRKTFDQLRAANPDAVVNEISQNKTVIRQMLA